MDIIESVFVSLEKLEDEFCAEPTLFYTEHDLVSRAYQLVQQELGKPKVYDIKGRPHYLVHHEYPTPFRCDMSGCNFKIMEEDERTPRGRKYQRGHYDLVIFNPNFIEQCDYQVAKGQNYKCIKRDLPRVIDAIGDAPILFGIEFMFNRDRFSSKENVERWWRYVLQDYQKLEASRRWKHRPFMQEIAMMAFDTTGEAGHHDGINADIDLKEGIRYCAPEL